MSTEAFISHRTPERLRIKIPGKKGDASWFSALVGRLSGLQGIRHVDASPLTGSVLLLIEPGQAVELESISGGMLSLRSGTIPQGSIRQKAAFGLREFDRKVKGFTGGELDIPSLVFAGLVAMGIYQLSIGNITAPAWYVAFWYASSIVFSDPPSESSRLGAEDHMEKRNER
jgi:hypothetical protein